MQRVGEAVVDRVHELDSIAERRETLGGDRKSVRVAVETDQHEFGEALEEGFGMTRQAERRVDENCAGPAKGRGQQLDAAFEHHGDVDLVLCHGVKPPVLVS